MAIWIAAGVVVLAVTVVMYCCCWVSGMADRRSEAYFQASFAGPDQEQTEEQ